LGIASWTCSCTLENRPEATRCEACDAPAPGWVACLQLQAALAKQAARNDTWAVAGRKG